MLSIGELHMSLNQTEALESILTESTELTMEGLSFNKVDFNVKVPKFLKGVVTLLEGYLSKDTTELTHFNVSTNYREMKDGSYMAKRNHKVIQPKGLDVTYLEYIRSLSEIQKLVDVLVIETLKPFEMFLGQLLTIPDEARSHIESSTLDSIKLHNVEKARLELATNFSKNQAEKRPYGSLVGRTADWPIILEEYNTLNARVTSVSISEVQEYIETILSHVSKLITHMESDPETYRVSGVTASTLGKFVHHVASEVELMSVQNYNVKTLEESIIDAMVIAKK